MAAPLPPPQYGGYGWARTATAALINVIASTSAGSRLAARGIREAVALDSAQCGVNGRISNASPDG